MASSSPEPKKRRFFRDDLDDLPIPTSEFTPPTSISSNPGSPIKEPDISALQTFSDQLLAILDEDIATQVIQKLEDASGGDIERAVNMYFDGSWTTPVRRDPLRALMSNAHGKRPIESISNNFLTRTTNTVEATRKPLYSSTSDRWTRRYIGSFGVEGWAIGSGNNILKAGDLLLIERQNPNPPKKSFIKPNQAQLKSTKTAPLTRFPQLSKQGKQHMLVRFTTLAGREIGRLPQETGNYISTLLDQHIFTFDGVCIFAPDKIRTGDNILIQLRCYILPQAFKPITANKHEDRHGVWEVSETEEERAFKLRRIGLLHLFNAIGLEPLRGASVTRQTANARQQLIVAAQISDPKPPGMTRTSSQSSNDEGEDVAEDTLNLLYKKAQMYDPNMPTMDPPDTFKFQLRKYQKQALCWMIGKESGGEKDVRKQQSLNPMWEEYAWPHEEGKDIEGTQDGQFYVNPYSGEMSLILPTYESNLKGGILADGIKVFFLNLM